MNTMIPNPSKTITINKSSQFIMNRLHHIGAWSGNDTGITITEASIDKNLNMYKFKSKGLLGSLEFGNYGTVIVTPNGEESCTLTIEMGKNFGCIDDQYEANDCNNQISSFLSILSFLIGMKDEELTNYPKHEKKHQVRKIFSYVVYIFGFALGIAIIKAIISAL